MQHRQKKFSFKRYGWQQIKSKFARQLTYLFDLLSFAKLMPDKWRSRVTKKAETNRPGSQIDIKKFDNSDCIAGCLYYRNDTLELAIRVVEAETPAGMKKTLKILGNSITSRAAA